MYNYSKIRKIWKLLNKLRLKQQWLQCWKKNNRETERLKSWSFQLIWWLLISFQDSNWVKGIRTKLSVVMQSDAILRTKFTAYWGQKCFYCCLCRHLESVLNSIKRYIYLGTFFRAVFYPYSAYSPCPSLTVLVSWRWTEHCLKTFTCVNIPFNDF